MTGACKDPTQPLCLGTDVETDEPVTLSRTERFDPMLITGQRGTGKPTLCQHIARQQVTPDSSLCYVTGNPSLPEVGQDVPEQREGITLTPRSDGEPGLTTDLPADIGTAGAFSRIQLGRDTDSNTAVLRTLIEDLLAHRQRRPERSPCTIVLDAISDTVEMDQIALTRLFTEARKLRLHVVLTTHALDALPRSGARRVEESVMTYVTGSVAPDDAESLARRYPTPTAADLMSLPRYQWWLRHLPSDTDTQFVSSPPSSVAPDTA